MTTLYIRLPSKSAADNAPHWTSLACPFALVSGGGAIEREGETPLSDLAETAARAQRVVLLLAATDVTLLRVQMPPLSGARLKAALPHLVEDQLMSDPAECVIVAGEAVEGLRTVAVVQRGWLEILAQTFTVFGARRITALPAQLCRPYQAGAVSAAVAEHESDIDVTLRLSAQDGIGLTILPEHAETAAAEVVQALEAVVPQAPITLYVPQARVRAYQEAAGSALGVEERISVYADSWSRWIAAAGDAAPDLMTGLGIGAGRKIEWRPLRWPLALAALVLLINILGFNIDWWRMKREADALRAGMAQTFKIAFPKDPVSEDPVRQMRQKIATVRHDAGQTAPDDFTALIAHFGEAWNGVARSGNAAIAAIEYRDRALLVQLKAGSAPALTEQMKAALAARELTLTVAPAQSSSDIGWQIRSAK